MMWNFEVISDKLSLYRMYLCSNFRVLGKYSFSSAENSYVLSISVNNVIYFQTLCGSC